MAIWGSTAIVGAPLYNSSTGVAYVFLHSGSTWVLEATLTPSDGASGDEFGLSVAIQSTIFGATAIIGAPYHNGTGAAYVFSGSGSSWSQQAELTAAAGASGDEFGYSVAISSLDTAIIGAPYDNGTGAAYIFGNL